MPLSPLDWLLIASTLAVSLGIGLRYYRRASGGTGAFFLSGRQLPWWLAGTSMVATTFAADTPLAVAGIVARDGIAGNWIWWNGAIGGMLTVFLFARLWRRAGIVTDVQLVELRYAGRAAALLRGFRALYLGIPINCVIIGWVNLAMAKVLAVTLGWDRPTAVLACLGLTGIYAATSGLWGVVVADFFQFFLAIAGTLALAWFALRAPDVGGIAGLQAQLPAPAFELLPRVGGVPDAGAAATLALPVATFIAFIGVQWWASWYPGQEPGGGGYVAQRMMSARDERHSLLATLWFTIAHYCVRPWPWILTGLASVVLYPGLADPESGYVMVLRDHLPAGWRGLLLGAFFAAYMSTVGTQLNWGTSYVVNDFYRRFVTRAAAEAHYVRVSRGVTLGLMALGALVTFQLETIRQAWEFILESGAGLGLVLILRWYWWRVNAWSEISAMVAPAAGLLALRLFTTVTFPFTLLYLTAWTTLCWLAVTLLTRPEPRETLVAFYRRVHPGGPGWGPVAAVAGGSRPEPVRGLLLDWLAGVVLVYGILFGVGASIFGRPFQAAVCLAAAGAAAVFLHRDLSRRGWRAVTG